MKIPNWLKRHPDLYFMTLPMPYQEYFVRAYYYDAGEDKQIPATVPVEHIEDFLATSMTETDMWCAKGFAAARNVDKGDNLDFINDSEFYIVRYYLARQWYINAINCAWIKEDILQEDFEKECPFLNGRRL